MINELRVSKILKIFVFNIKYKLFYLMLCYLWSSETSVSFRLAATGCKDKITMCFLQATVSCVRATCVYTIYILVIFYFSFYQKHTEVKTWLHTKIHIYQRINNHIIYQQKSLQLIVDFLITYSLIDTYFGLSILAFIQIQFVQTSVSSFNHVLKSCSWQFFKPKSFFNL